VINKGQTLVCGKDVARAMGYKNPEKALRVHIEDDDKVVNKMDTTYGIKPTTFINESGLYSLILSSKLLNKNTLQEKLWKDTWTKMMG
jgi:prophage antirepressor-like protein